jgi:hypothetical protein
MLPIIREGLVLELHFNELEGSTVYDLSGYNNNGTIYGATRVQEGFGKALSFDGVDDYVGIPDSASLKGMSALTVEVWIKPEMIRNQGIISKWNSWVANTGGSYIMWMTSTGTIGWGVITTTSYSYLYDTPTLAANKWYHLVGVYDGSQIRLYINTELKGTPKSLSGSVASTTDLLFIGKYGTAFFKGIIDEVFIWNRALSESEIQTIYNYYMKKRMEKGL